LSGGAQVGTPLAGAAVRFYIPGKGRQVGGRLVARPPARAARPTNHGARIAAVSGKVISAPHGVSLSALAAGALSRRFDEPSRPPSPTLEAAVAVGKRLFLGALRGPAVKQGHKNEKRCIDRRWKEGRGWHVSSLCSSWDDGN